MASALFCLLAAVGRNLIVANTLGSFALLTVMVMGGFIVSRGNISSSVEKLQVQYTTYMFTLSEWWIWGCWFLPLIYAQNAIAVNEFLGKSWAHVNKRL